MPNLLLTLALRVPLATGLSFAWRESGLYGKGIILVLFLGSMFAWSVMITKGSTLRHARITSRDFRDAYRRGKEPLGLLNRGFQAAECPLFEVYKAGGKEAARHLTTDLKTGPDLFDAGRVPEGHLDVSQIDQVRNAVDREMNTQGFWLESYLGSLATAVSGGPLLGLLGTVWGIMDAFGSMAVVGTATISAVAPGISGALITTVVGLIVAIPSLIGYNMLMHRVDRLTVEMENFATEFVASIEARYGRRGP